MANTNIGKYHDEVTSLGFIKGTKDYFNAYQRVRYKHEPWRREAGRLSSLRNYSKIKSNKQRKAKERYAANRDELARQKHESRIRRQPWHGLKRLSVDLERGRIDHDEYSRRIDERINFAYQINEKRTGKRRDNSISSDVRPNNCGDYESEMRSDGISRRIAGLKYEINETGRKMSALIKQLADTVRKQ